ncbi:MAG: DinB family protein [Candidatus Methylomirabilaceae bacterium]
MKSLTLASLALVLVSALPRTAAAQAAPSGVRGDMIAQLDDAAGKIQQLAEAIPQDKYTWRPGAGVRSMSEAFMHVAGGNYYLMTFAGVPAPAGTSENMDAITDRAKVIDNLKRSFAHARAAIVAASDADLDKPTEMFGQKTTFRGVFMTEVAHAHEHLGQLIAYARMNGITPPWSMAAR